jgi:hypothetical protein
MAFVVAPAGALEIEMITPDPGSGLVAFDSDITSPEEGYFEVSITKRFNEYEPDPGHLYPVILEFSWPHTEDVDYILITNELITNLTGNDWADFEFFLVNFPDTPSYAAASFYPHAGTTSDVFGDPTELLADMIAFDGGIVSGASGQLNVYNIGIDIDTGALPQEGTRVFWLKQQPTPEPGTLALLGMAALAFARRPKRA